MHYIQAAKEQDIDELNRIACEAEEYWGYDAEDCVHFISLLKEGRIVPRMRFDLK